MNISMFQKPDHHPYDMLGNYEKEAFLAWFLSRCIDANDIDAEIKTVANEDNMVSEGLLVKIEEQTYKLTNKAKGLLYSQYAAVTSRP